MKQTIFKPNSNNSGGMMALEISSDKSPNLYVNMVPQTGWDSNKKRGSFQNAKEKSVAFKLSESEAGDLIFAFRNGGVFHAYHTLNGKTTIINVNSKVERYGPKGSEVDRPRFSISVSAKDNGVEKKVYLPIEAGEAECMAILLTEFVRRSLEAAGAESQNYSGGEKSYDNSRSQPSAPKKQETPSAPSYEDDDIPF
jgi:hypothetical protein